MTLICPGAIQVPSNHDGGAMSGGQPHALWHTYEADPHGLTAERAARGLIAAGNEVHLTFNPLSGEYAQILPPNRAGRGLQHTAAQPTNGMGSVCIQVEVIAFAAQPFTSLLSAAGLDSLGVIVDWMRGLGVPDVWPAGQPPGQNGPFPRSSTLWVRGGHFGHSQVPQNSHWDPGLIDTSVIIDSGGNMPLTAAEIQNIADMSALEVMRHVRGQYQDETGGLHPNPPKGTFADKVDRTAARVTDIDAKVDALLARPPVDVPALAAAIVALLPAQVGLTVADVEQAVTTVLHRT